MSDRHPEVAALIGRTARRWRALTALRAWSLAAAGASLVLALALIADRVVAPEGPASIALWTVATLAALVSLVWMLAVMRRPPSDRQVARFIEERCPELEDTLVTAAGHDGDDRGPMAAALAADAARRTRAIDADRIISRAAIRRAALRATVASLVLGVLVAASTGPVANAARLLGFYLFPERLAFDVVPGDVKVRAGEPLRIVVRTGNAGTIAPVLLIDEQGERREARMDAAAGGFAAGFPQVERSFRYAITAAGATSRAYAVTVLRPPAVERIDLRYEYPAGFGMEARDEEDGGDIYGPAGTRVRVTVHADKRVARAALNLGGGPPVPLEARGGTLEAELTITGEGSYRVVLADTDGLRNPGDTEYFIRTLDDRPPAVRIVRPAADRRVTSIEEVPIEAVADDDFGVASLELVYAVRGAEEVAVPFERAGSQVAVTGRQMLYLEDLDVRPGDFVAYYARARDVSRGKRSSEARSDIFFLDVTPFDEEFVASQSQSAGGGSGDPALDEMVQAQKDIITATWSLDRRGREAGAQSRDDVRTVARAQGELRARAMAAAAEAQRTRAFRQRRQAGRQGGEAPPDATGAAMAAAAAAMEKAEQQLQAVRTSEALPHEMAALNELLRAQAEVRRREVQRQQANGAGGRGSNRQQQDLSSLFDRELAREQQTNYETPSTSEVREEAKTDETVDRIRELARRQDELNRAQEALAENREATSREEMRRQLERLTREQSELRREAEELAQQQAGANQQAGRALQQVSEEMQGAASELRRDNPGQATARGARAAEGLRELEQQLRGGQPGERRRAVGEMQLESRQIAEAQRRLGEASSEGRGGEPDDAARRRAVEQERLADRTERLEESVRQLAEAPPQGSDGSGQQALSDAARELDEQRLSERMRDAARRMQAGEKGQPWRPAPGEAESLARALEQVAGRLGAATGQSEEARRLTEQLSRIRELREELATLDRDLAQLREQAGGQPGPQSGRGERPGGEGEAPPGQSPEPWEQARELIEALRRQQGLEMGDSADGFNPGRSAPGTEAWKQDFATWDELKVQVAAALEQAERDAASRLRDRQSRDRLNAGATQTVPEQYRRLVDRYYRALASQPGEGR